MGPAHPRGAGCEEICTKRDLSLHRHPIRGTQGTLTGPARITYCFVHKQGNFGGRITHETCTSPGRLWPGTLCITIAANIAKTGLLPGLK